MSKKICPYCGKEFISDNKQKIYCSKSCQIYINLEKQQKKRAEEKPKVNSIHKCELCGKEFIAKTVNSKYCGEECLIKVTNQRKREKNLKRKANMLCMECGKPIGEYRSSVYCSKKCQYEASKRRLRESKPKKPKPKRQRKPKLSISEICRLAASEHLTYGQYVEKYGV